MSNPWVQFQQLLDPGAKTLVTVKTVNQDGTSIVTLRSGSDVRVQGDSVAAGATAIIQQGQIRGRAPNLPVKTVSV